MSFLILHPLPDVLDRSLSRLNVPVHPSSKTPVDKQTHQIILLPFCFLPTNVGSFLPFLGRFFQSAFLHHCATKNWCSPHHYSSRSYCVHWVPFQSTERWFKSHSYREDILPLVIHCLFCSTNPPWCLGEQSEILKFYNTFTSHSHIRFNHLDSHKWFSPRFKAVQVVVFLGQLLALFYIHLLAFHPSAGSLSFPHTFWLSIIFMSAAVGCSTSKGGSASLETARSCLPAFHGAPV